MTEYQLQSRPLSQSFTNAHGDFGGPSLSNDLPSSDTSYTRSLTTSNDKEMSPGTGKREISRSRIGLPPHISHRRARTEIISSEPGDSSSRQISQASLDDIDLGSAENTPGKSNFLSGLFHGDNDTDLTKDTNRWSADTPPKEGQSMGGSIRSQAKIAVPSSLRQVTSALFASKSQDEGPQPAAPEPADDEFLNLDINAALFPSGSASLSAEDAFKNLQENAEHVIRQLQNAYKLRTFTLHETIAEKRTQQDELEESKSRVQDTKSQLDEMAARATKHDRMMKDLAEELRVERQKWREEEEARKQSEIPQIKDDVETCSSQGTPESASHRRDQKHPIGATVSSDSGFESGDDSVAESTVSKRNDDADPQTTRSSSDTATTTPTVLSPQSQPRSSMAQSQLSPVKSPQSPSRPTAYDRVLKGLSSSNIGSSFSGLMSPSRCANCRGAASSDAWNVVAVMREENKALKNRMGELESAVEECITLAGG